jgi:hypothetical protein
MRWQRRIGNRAQLARRLGISEVTLSRYIRAINLGVVDQPFNASGYVLNRNRTGYVGAKPRKRQKEHLPEHHNNLEDWRRNHFSRDA